MKTKRTLFMTCVLFIINTTVHSITCTCVGSLWGDFIVSTVHTSGSSCYDSSSNCNGYAWRDGQSTFFASMDTDICTTVQAISSCVSEAP